jgi:hypothetical protein
MKVPNKIISQLNLSIMGRVWEIFFSVCDCVCVCVCVCMLGGSPIHGEAGSPTPTSRRLPLLYTSAAPVRPTTSEPAHDSFDAKCNPLCCCCYYYDYYYYKPLPRLWVLFSTKCISRTLLFIFNFYMG